MKKIFTSITVIAAMVASGVVLSSWNEIGAKHETLMPGGAPSGCASDPLSGGASCAKSGCHDDGVATPQAGMITSDIPVGGYTGGVTYSITVTIAHAGAEFGFEASCQNASGTVLGTLAPIGTTETQLKGSGNYITHKSTSNAGTDGRSWTFNWTAPVAGTGPVSFYGSVMSSNLSGDEFGDLVYSSTLAVVENTGVGIESVASEEISIYPTISNGQFTLQVSNEQLNNNCTLEIYNIAGAKVYATQISTIKSNIIMDAPAGLYLALVKAGNTSELTKIVIK